MGAWIEIVQESADSVRTLVAPFMGAWIEIYLVIPPKIIFVSHPLWVRGLKYVQRFHSDCHFGRTLYGCVD